LTDGEAGKLQIAANKVGVYSQR